MLVVWWITSTMCGFYAHDLILARDLCCFLLTLHVSNKTNKGEEELQYNKTVTLIRIYKKYIC